MCASCTSDEATGALQAGAEVMMERMQCNTMSWKRAPAGSRRRVRLCATAKTALTPPAHSSLLPAAQRHTPLTRAASRCAFSEASHIVPEAGRTVNHFHSEVLLPCWTRLCIAEGLIESGVRCRMWRLRPGTQTSSGPPARMAASGSMTSGAGVLLGHRQPSCCWFVWHCMLGCDWNACIKCSPRPDP